MTGRLTDQSFTRKAKVDLARFHYVYQYSDSLEWNVVFETFSWWIGISVQNEIFSIHDPMGDPYCEGKTPANRGGGQVVVRSTSRCRESWRPYDVTSFFQNWISALNLWSVLEKISLGVHSSKIATFRIKTPRDDRIYPRRGKSSPKRDRQSKDTDWRKGPPKFLVWTRFFSDILDFW